MGLVYEKKKEYDSAIESYKKAVEIEPLYAEAFYNMANSYKIKRDFNRAIDNYKKAIDIESDYALAYLFMGRSLYTSLFKLRSCFFIPAFPSNRIAL